MTEKPQGPGKNQLTGEKSPYLLQHADNPVHWQPWGNEAFLRAETEDKPIFLSIGYATCHWCHVMAHESFEDREVADILNEHFVAIKVDREERPDVDKIYMSVCQALTGRGGWPLSVFMTPEGKPFFAGSYFPKNSRMGMPGFVDILNQLAHMWQNDRDRIITSGDKITEAIQPDKTNARGALPDRSMLETGCRQLGGIFDPRHGGFGKAPKFPTPHNLTFLLRWHFRDANGPALQMVEKTLTAMRYGGIFDQVGFGFHRYSVDDQWLAPHFEKMLYDQALLAMAYLEAFQATENSFHARVAREIFTYVLRDMTDSTGGFYSAEDADSEGEEGLFYLWTPKEVIAILGEGEGNLFCDFYEITEKGNFEGHKSIARITRPIEAFAKARGLEPDVLVARLEESRQKLFLHRKNRIHPLKDDKILTSWNGLMIAALAKGAQVLGESAYARAADKAAKFILKTLKGPDGRLLRRYRTGEAALAAYLNDYAFFVWGLLELYEATFKPAWLEAAIHYTNDMLDLFEDTEIGGLFFTGKGNEALITRSREVYDGALPSGNSVAALNLFRLHRMTGNGTFAQKAETILCAFSNEVSKAPMGYTQFLNAVDFMVGPGREIVLSGDWNADTTQDMLKAIRKPFFPNKVVLFRPDQGEILKDLTSLAPFTADMKPVQTPAVFICEAYACKAPITKLSELENAFGH